MLKVYLKICLKDTPVSAYTVHSTGLGLMSFKSVVILSHKIYWQGSVVRCIVACRLSGIYITSVQPTAANLTRFNKNLVKSAT